MKLSLIKFCKQYCVGIVITFFLTGCAAKIDHGFIFETDSKIDIGTITSTDQKYEVDVEGMLRAALVKALKEKDIFWTGYEKQKHYSLEVKIMNYEAGNAFKRWLLPFYGSTILGVQCELFDHIDGTSVSKFTHKRRIDAGGFYTIGGWETIFNTVASDIAADLKRRMTDEVQGFYIELDPWLEHEDNVPKTNNSKKIYLLPIHDIRSDQGRIGERHAAFNVSMGNVYLNRRVSDYLEEAIQNELLASGHNLTKEGQEINLAGEIIKFWVWTETTPLYWDIKGEIHIKLRVLDPENNKKITEKEYSTLNTSRTYVWPTEELASQVLSDGIKNLMYDIRKDSIWLKTMQNN